MTGNITDSLISTKAVIAFLTGEILDLHGRIAELRKDSTSRAVAEASRLLLICNYLDVLACNLKNTQSGQALSLGNKAPKPSIARQRVVQVDTDETDTHGLWFDPRVKLPEYKRVFRIKQPTGAVFPALRKYGGGIYKLHADCIGNASASAFDFTERVTGYDYVWQYV